MAAENPIFREIGDENINSNKKVYHIINIVAPDAKSGPAAKNVRPGEKFSLILWENNR